MLGLLVIILMVKERKMARNYTVDQSGTVKRHIVKLKIDDDENDTDSDVDMGLPDDALLVKAKKLDLYERFKLVWKQTALAIKSDWINALVFYCTMVNKMLMDSLNYIIVIWLASFLISDKQPPKLAHDPTRITEDESEEIFKQIVYYGKVGSLAAVPFIGYLTDKLSTGYELIVAFGVRCAACIMFYRLDTPKGDDPIDALVCLVIAANM